MGALIGSACIGPIATRLGRRGGLLANNLLVIIAVLLMVSAKYFGSWPLLLVGRIVVGVNCGINSGVVILYLNEIAPKNVRGSVGTVFQLGGGVSFTTSLVLGQRLALGTEEHWPWAVGITVVPALAQLVGLALCPESPKYLLIDRDEPGRARASLAWLRNGRDVTGEMEQLMEEREAVRRRPVPTWRNIFTDRSLRVPLLVATVMITAQRLTGISAITFFSTEIFLRSGLSLEAAQLGTVVMGGLQILTTLVSLQLVERCGRKVLMLTGLAGMFLTTGLIYASLLTVSSVPAMAYLAVAAGVLMFSLFAIGPGPIPWFYTAELFDQSYRALATSIVGVTGWTWSFVTALLFPIVEEYIHEQVFVFFMVAQVTVGIYIWRFVPETKGKTTAEMMTYFGTMQDTHKN